MNSLVFEEIEEGEFLMGNTSGCTLVHQQKSCWCTRNCTNCERNNCPKPRNDESFATAEEWGKFLEIEGGVIQY